MDQMKNKTVEQLLEENEKYKIELIGFNDIAKDLEKEIRGMLWLWLLIPLFGFLIYMGLIQRRKDSEKYAPALLNVKLEIMKNELKIKINDEEISSKVK